MKEEFLHYVWRYQLFPKTTLCTVGNQSLKVIKSGDYNMNSGPDFFNAKLLIGDLIWVGNVEIHVKSSDWYLHQHEKDKNYDSIILHVVWEDDIEVFDKNDKEIPTFVLSTFISKNLLDSYYNLLSKNNRWIPCEKMIDTIGSLHIESWKTSLYFEKLESKSVLIEALLKSSKNDYEAVLFKLIAKNFGLNINGSAFLDVANSFDFSILRKVQHDFLKITALLFGQSGFLDDDIDDEYYRSLKNEYQYLQRKYSLKKSLYNRFEFFRLRPSNFPTIRIAQLAALYHKHQNLFSKLLKCTNLDEFYSLFDVSLDVFWETHFTFKKESTKKKKSFTKSFIDLLIVNTIIPLKFNYLKLRRSDVQEKDFLLMLSQIKPEKNSIISKFSELKIKSKNAFDSQSLIFLKKNYCAKKCCLQCAIGNSLLKK